MQKWSEIYTDGSKLDGRFGAGIHSTCLRQFASLMTAAFSKRKYALSIKLSIGLKLTDNLSQMFVFWSDSQAALRALDSPHISSKSVLTYRKSLENITTQMSICLSWDPGHRDIAGNCKADELAREGSTTELQSLHNDYSILIATLKLKFE